MPLDVAVLAHHMQTDEPAADSWEEREMQRALDTAVQETTRRTGMLDGVTVTVQVSVGRGDRSARLPYVRLASVGSATGPGGVVADVVDADLLAGLVPVPGGAAGSWSVTCTGKPWPAALEQSALDWAAHLYDVQRQALQGPDSDEPTPTFSLPNRVEELQRPYLLVGAA